VDGGLHAESVDKAQDADRGGSRNGRGKTLDTPDTAPVPAGADEVTELHIVAGVHLEVVGWPTAIDDRYDRR
jgi:hypothetical protein